MEAVQDPNAGVDVAAIAAENAALRAQLLEENEKLRKALAESQAAGITAKGLTDEDVRRLEHPEEFVQAENDAFRTQLEDLKAEVARITGAAANAPQQPDVQVSASELTDEELQAELERRHAAGQ